MERENPVVSVIIPTYNRADLVKRAIQSVLGQNYEEFELIVVDDASEDNTREVIQEFDDPRLKYLRHEQNRGGSAARNTGIKESRGKYISLLDDDDELLPRHLENLVATIEDLGPEWGVVYSGKVNIDGEKRTKDYPDPGWQGDIFEKILVEGSIQTSTLLIRRSCFDKVGMFDEEFPRHQDWEMNIRLSKHFKYFSISEITVKRYVGGSPSYKKVKQSKKLLINKFDEEISSLGFFKRRQFYFKNHNALARYAIGEDRVFLGFYLFFKGIFNDPFQFKAIGYTVLRLVTGLKRIITK